jgi:exodeoxyribonuclease VII large subunit
MESKILTVAELTSAIKLLLEPAFRKIVVQGEISNSKLHSSGHFYFSLKDDAAQISCAFFKNSAKNLSRFPKDGDQVIVKGELSIYPPRGNYQIIVKELELAGIGELLLKLHQLKEKLKNKGWFDPTHKKPIPKVPKTIGIVTSATGAVIQDILNVLTRRFNSFNLILNPVKVQGIGAAEEIAKAINDFNTHRLADVIIVGRGGGSLEDLWAFNEEVVATAIFNSKIPIISAVGHETDYCIADFVADVRAPTPSAAAELVTLEKEHIIKNLLSYRQQMLKCLDNSVIQRRHHLNSLLKQPIFSSSYHIMGRYLQQFDDMKSKIPLSLQMRLDKEKSKLTSLAYKIRALNPLNRLRILKEQHKQYEKRIVESWRILQSLRFNTLNASKRQQQFYESLKNIILMKRQNLIKLVAHLRSIDPKNLLKKGYTILFSVKDNSIILSVDNLAQGDAIMAKVSDGSIKATINNIEKP